MIRACTKDNILSFFSNSQTCGDEFPPSFTIMPFLKGTTSAKYIFTGKNKMMQAV